MNMAPVMNMPCIYSSLREILQSSISGGTPKVAKVAWVASQNKIALSHRAGETLHMCSVFKMKLLVFVSVPG